MIFFKHFFNGLLLGLYVFIINLHAQNTEPDSLKQSIERIISESRQMPYEQAVIYLKKAEEIANRSLSPEGLAKTLYEKGYRARMANDFIKAIQYHARALSLLDHTTDTLLKIKVLVNLATDLRKVNFEKNAYKYLIQALELSEKIHDDKNIAISLHGLGNIYINLLEYKKALPYFYKALAIELRRKNERGIEYNYSNLAEIYTQIKQFDSARKYMGLSLMMAKKLYGNHLGIEQNLAGHLYFKKGNFRMAEKNFSEALSDLEARQIDRYIANTKIMLGKTHLKLGKKKPALSEIKSGLELAKQIHSKENVILGFDALINYYSALGDYKKALQYAQEKEKWKDNMLNNQTKRGIQILEVLHNLKEKDKKITALALDKQKMQKKAKMNFFLWVITLVSALLGIGLILSFFKLKQKEVELELEKKNQQIISLIHQENLIKSITSHALGSKDNVDANDDEAEVCNKFLETPDLTEREREVLWLICKGKNNKEIARELYISLNTVKTHIRHIYDKLNVKNRLDLLSRVEKPRTIS